MTETILEMFAVGVGVGLLMGIFPAFFANVRKIIR